MPSRGRLFAQWLWAVTQFIETNEVHYAIKVALGVTLLAIPVFTSAGAQDIRLTWAMITVRGRKNIGL